ncbi:MAG: CTP synthase [Candidatus Sungiibacteriota bacterium]|uniref:CTP synthase n=1 Tax=Candidatus Sungiibacteriota bacterium TaxID=2750080 RepID=A0A7T5RJF6_9BACT|nr:MAG: CTP synthase [Candidatus Sungbacteria bacterium]
MARYIFVCGGVMSGIGKGIAVASIGRILKSRGFRVTAVKIDPYLNVDAGTMNPVEHGEVFVTEDGMECDQDIGNYERFLDENISRENYMTSGSVYQAVIERERNLEYGGKCVQVVPHIPHEVIRRLERAAKKARADFTVIEIGGTVGEYENILFLEAARMMHLSRPQDVLFVLVSYLPIPAMIGEMKTKPTQHAVRAMNAAGIQPDIIIARSVVPMDDPRKKKLAVFCNVSEEDIISAPDVKVIYDVPVNFEKDHLGDRILDKFSLKARRRDLGEWKNFIQRTHRFRKPVRIGIVGKYFGTGVFTLADSYISVIEAIKHASWSLGFAPEISWLNAETYEKNRRALSELKSYGGIIVPGGFGSRGVEGKIKTIEFCRKNKIPFLGLCYGLQLAVIEFARNVCKLRGAHTTEVNPKTKYPVIHTLPEQLVNIREKRMGGSMRLGAYTCELKPGTMGFDAYATKLITERHRHRYEVNNDHREILEKRGMVFSGINPERNLVEIIELSAKGGSASGGKNHPFFMGTQFHPEFKSRPLKPHPLFKGFIRAATKTRV